MPPDPNEPQNTAQAISEMGLSYVVLTSVNRDDLEDDGAGHFAQTIQVLREKCQNLFVEVLTPDFRGQRSNILKVLNSNPHVFAHNIETVERLTPQVRDRRAGYRQSLDVLKQVKMERPDIFTKSSIMLGLGETEEEIHQALKDLRAVACDIVTLGQYLRPKPRHLSVQRYVSPKEFDQWKEQALSYGFLYAASGPLVRSSYRAGEFFIKNILEKGLYQPDSLRNI